MFSKSYRLFVIVLAMLLALTAVAQNDMPASGGTGAIKDARLQKAITILSGAVKYKTVSWFDTAAVASAEFVALHEYLRKSFPLVHKHLQREVVNRSSLLYTWPGANTSLKPILLSAHLDVVPAEEASLDKWEHNPFSGTVADGQIWGRGTMDDKYRVIAILEAIEQLLQNGYKNKRTILLAFGHDEEVGGKAGAGEISALLQARGTKLEAVFDEGLCVTERMLPGIDRQVAFIGTASKGNINFLLTVNGEGGHSSIPPTETPISILSQAITRITDNPFKSKITPSTHETLRLLSYEMGGIYRFSMNFYWLLKGVIRKRLARYQTTDALIRTKVAPTIIQSGDKSNVLPRVATAVINVRILTGETDQSVLAYLKKVINDDRVKIEQYGLYTPPSPVTTTDTWIYRALESTIHQIFPGAAVATAIFPGATDAKHFVGIADNIFLFAPQVVSPENGTLIHNVNERLEIDVFEHCIQFYDLLLQKISN